MEVVLVMLHNLQEYILENIHHLQLHGNENITVITDRKFNNFFQELNINLVNIEDLIPKYCDVISNFSSNDRNGFWKLTSYRFESMYAYMKTFNVNNVLHLENDVLLYKKLDMFHLHDTSKLLLTMDSKNRCIPGLMFIPNDEILKQCLDMFDASLNDMQNFSKCYYELNDEIDTLPIFLENNTNDVTKMVSKNFKHYHCIFDAAAIGQYLGGTPRYRTNGFINETCVINYSKYKFIWKTKDMKKIPFIIVDNNEFPIINLHIHCKNLKEFSNSADTNNI